MQTTTITTPEQLLIDIVDLQTDEEEISDIKTPKANWFDKDRFRSCNSTPEKVVARAVPKEVIPIIAKKSPLKYEERPKPPTSKKDDMWGEEYPLREACLNGNMSGVTELLTKGKDPTEFNCYPIRIAYERKFYDILKTLLTNTKVTSIIANYWVRELAKAIGERKTITLMAGCNSTLISKRNFQIQQILLAY